MRMLLALVVTLALMCGAANAQVPGDMIDLSKADFYGTNVSEWAPTVALTGVELRSGSNLGVRAEFDRAHVNSRWPDVLNWPPDGYLQWTLYACVPVPKWTCAGMHEFWSDMKGAPRVWTGAHPMEKTLDGRSHWKADWAYDGRWGAMQTFDPEPGKQMAFFMVAGAIRPGTSDHVTVRERSNVVVGALALQAIWRPTAVDNPPPPPDTTLAERVRVLESQVLQLTNAIAHLSETTDEHVKIVVEGLASVELRLERLEQRVLNIQCEASANLGFARIPVRCTIK